MNKFYQNRRCHKYYTTVKQWLESYKDRRSILDIGSADTPVASWGSFGLRYSIDPIFHPNFKNVLSVQGSWPDDSSLLPSQIEVITCLQVLEHIQDVQPFVNAIFATATYRIIISVPFIWKAGTCKTHIHDPINRRKLRSWTKRKPLRTKVVEDRGNSRLIEEYHP